MIGFLPKNIILDYTSIPQDNISAFDKMDGYISGSFRIFEDKVYKALTIIAPLSDINFFDEDTSKLQAFNNNSETFIDYENVDVIIGTLVWEQSSESFFESLVNETVNLDTDLSNPAKFTAHGAVDTYRKDFIYPNGKEDTLYWGYNGSTNQTTMFDEVVNAQSLNDRKVTGTDISFTAVNNTITSLTEFDNFFDDDKILIEGTTLNPGEYTIDTMAIDKLSFTIKETGVLVDEAVGPTISIYTYTYIIFTESGVDKIAIFNTDCEEIEIKYNGSVIETIIMVDKTNITDFESFCFDLAIVLNRLIVTVVRDYSVEFEITFKGKTQAIGEVVVGKSFTMFKAQDSVSLNNKSFNNLREATNGDVYFTDEAQKIVAITSYDMLLPTKSVPVVVKQNNALINQLMVINGSNEDKEDLTYLIAYGWFSSHTTKPKTNEEDSTYKFEFRSIL